MYGKSMTIKSGPKGGLRPGKAVVAVKPATGLEGKIVDRSLYRQLSDKAGPSFKKKKK